MNEYGALCVASTLYVINNNQDTTSIYKNMYNQLYK